MELAPDSGSCARACGPRVSPFPCAWHSHSARGQAAGGAQDRQGRAPLPGVPIAGDGAHAHPQGEAARS
jgi:hypothetical protein